MGLEKISFKKLDLNSRMRRSKVPLTIKYSARKGMQSNKIDTDRYWQTAGERVSLYLRCLNFPAAQAFELALRALNLADQNMIGDDSRNDPVAASMEALQSLLREQKSPPFGGEHAVGCKSPSGDGRPVVCLSPMPPIRRLHMRAQELRPSSLRALFENLAEQLKTYSGGIRMRVAGSAEDVTKRPKKDTNNEA